jgi:general secretion pathway protein H
MNNKQKTPSFPVSREEPQGFPVNRYSHQIYGKESQGFTLLELLVVLIILSIASGMVGIAVYRGSGAFEVKKVTKQIATTLRYARNHAVAEKELYSFIVWDKKRAYGLYTDFSSEEDPEDASPLMYRDIPEAVSITIEPEEELKRIDFSPTGSSSGGEITITNQKGRKFFIVVNRITGKVKIIKNAEQ